MTSDDLAEIAGREIGGVTDAELQRREAEAAPLIVAPTEEVARNTAVRIDVVAADLGGGRPGVLVQWAAMVGGELLEGAFEGDPTNADVEGMLVASWRAFADARAKAAKPAIVAARSAERVDPEEPYERPCMHGIGALDCPKCMG